MFSNEANTEKYKSYKKRQEVAVKKSNRRVRLAGGYFLHNSKQSDSKKASRYMTLIPILLDF